MSNNFRVGQKVVCIFDGQWRWQETDKPGEGPSKGDVLTVSFIGRSYPDKVPIISVEERPGYFGAANFRPAVERGTDTGMAILTKILLDNMVDA